MNILLWILSGGIAGWVASLIVGTDESMGVIANVMVGIAGAFIGGWIAHAAGMAPDNNSDADRPTSLVNFAIAVVGAVILLFIFNLIW